MATNIDFIVKNGLQVATTATVNSVDVLANDYATLLSAYANDAATFSSLTSAFQANDYVTYTDLVGKINSVQDNVGAGESGYRANDFATYTTLVSEYSANDFNTYTTLQSEFQANDFATFNAAQANDYNTYTTLQGEFAANDFATFNAAQANDYATYTTLQGEFAANDFATFNAAQANDYATYTTLQGEFAANDVATLNSALANDFNSYSTLVSEYNANDYTTFTTLQSAYRANDYTTWSGLNSFAGIKANSSVTLTAGDGLSGGGDLTASRTFAVDATVVRTSGDQSISGEKTFSDSIVVEGDLTVNGNVTTVSSTNLEVTDRFIQLASNAAGAPSADVGIYLNRGAEGNSAVYYDETNNYFALVDTLDPASNSVVSPTNYSNLRVEHLVVNSTDLVTNLNADLLDGQQGSYYLDYTNATNTDLITLDSVTANGNSTTNSIVVGGLNADSGTLYVDSTNSSVGIGTVTPKAKLQVEELGLDTSTLVTSATTADQVLDSFAATAFRTAKYLVQVHDTINNDYHTSEILLIHDGTTAYITEYAIVFTDTSLASFDADISGGNVRLLVTPTNATNSIKVSRSAITL
jgi:hypothetical protein